MPSSEAHTKQLDLQKQRKEHLLRQHEQIFQQQQNKIQELQVIFFLINFDFDLHIR